MNNRAFTMLSQMNRNFNQSALKVQSYLLSACLLENINDYTFAKEKFNKGRDLLIKERKNMDTDELTNIANSLTRLKGNKASELLISVHQQKEEQSSAYIGELSGEQLNETYAIKAQNALAVGKKLYEKK